MFTPRYVDAIEGNKGGMVKEQPAADKSGDERPSPKIIAIELTSRCNQQCVYCYNPGRRETGAGVDLDLTLLPTILDQLDALPDLLQVILTGGEPLLLPQCLDIIRQINDRGHQVKIISNGGLIDAEQAAALAEHNVEAVQMTLTGADAETHDEICGKGTFERAIAAIRHVRDAGIRPDGSYLCTTKNYQSAGDILTLLADEGVKVCAFNRYNPAGEARWSCTGLMPTRTQVMEALTAVDKVAGERELHVVCTMPIPPCVFDWKEYPNIKPGSCSAGTEYGMLTVNPDGSVRLCPMLHDPVGSIVDSSFKEILNGEAVTHWRKQVPDFCADCPLGETCLGGCTAAAEWMFGTSREVDPFLAQHVLEDYESRLRTEIPERIAEQP